MPLNRTLSKSQELSVGITTIRCLFSLTGTADPVLVRGAGIQLTRTGVGQYAATVDGVGDLQDEAMDFEMKTLAGGFYTASPFNIFPPRTIGLAITQGDPFAFSPSMQWHVPASSGGPPETVPETPVFRNSSDGAVSFGDNGDFVFFADTGLGAGQQFTYTLRRYDSAGVLAQTYATAVVTSFMNVFGGPTWNFGSDVVVGDLETLTISAADTGAGNPSSPELFLAVNASASFVDIDPSDTVLITITVTIKNSSV